MNSEPCTKLTTKKMFIPALEDGAFKEKVKAGYEGHFWCCCTGAEFGPDDKPVNLLGCTNPDRLCFKTEG